jgi:hypothetical protein
MQPTTKFASTFRQHTKTTANIWELILPKNLSNTRVLLFFFQHSEKLLPPGCELGTLKRVHVMGGRDAITAAHGADPGRI